MPLVNSLLTAIVRADGDALVMHVGEKPYVVTSSGPVELSTSGLNLEAMSGMITRLLPEDAVRTLSEFGAVEQELQPPPEIRDRFTVVVARGGDDVWIEIRRRRAPAFARVEPVASFGAASPESARVEPAASFGEASPSPVPEPMPTVVASPSPPPAPEPEEPVVEVRASEPEPVVMTTAEPAFAREEQPASYGETSSASARPESIASDGATAPEPAHAGGGGPKRPEIESREGGPVAPVVVPLTRTVRIEMPPRQTSGRPDGVERLLSIAAARGASVLYLTSQSLPFVKVDGEIRALDGEEPLASPDVEAALLELMPEDARNAHNRGEPAEWVSEFEGIGRIRCTTFRDYRGAGALFHLISAKPVSAEQLGLAREIQALATESDGLVLIASPRGGGKSTLVAALVDVINKQHGGYVITLERQIRIVHDNRQSLVSQREVRGSAADVVTIARAALRENPDVLVIEDHNAPEVIQLALDAAGSGQLVLLSVTAGSTTTAVMRLIDLFPPDRHRAMQAVLGERLRGAVGQVLVRKAGGGRIAARELLLANAAVASLIAEGQFAQLAVAMDSGRKHGMVPLNDVLLGLVQSGVIDVREAYRKADDRAALVALLKRGGVDTSFAERLA